MGRHYCGKGGGSDSLYKKEYCELLVKHMSQGYSFGSFGANVNCGRRTLLNWVEEHPDFADAKQKGHEAAKKFFEKLALKKMKGKPIEDFDPKRSDTALIIFFLKTRFKEEYSERIELAGPDENAIKISYSLDQDGN